VSKRLLLCTDLDRTLIPNGPQAESREARKYFEKLAMLPQVTLVYVSGRHLALIEQAITDYSLPKPDWAITDVGTALYKHEGGQWQPSHAWVQAIASDWSGNTHSDVQKLFSDIGDLRLQESDKQSSYKLSYYVSLKVDKNVLQSQMDLRLKNERIQANFIWSVDELKNVGLLDILPVSANKRHALEFLMSLLGFEFCNTVFAGDSGNDLPVFVSPIQSVLVANTPDDVKAMALRESEVLGLAKAVYIAQGGYRGMNGNYSAGILEGVSHFFPQIDKWLDGYEHAAL